MGINMFDSFSIFFKVFVFESLMLFSVREEIFKKLGVVKVISLERLIIFVGVILYFFKSNVLKFFSWGSFSILLVMLLVMFNEKFSIDKE